MHKLLQWNTVSREASDWVEKVRSLEPLFAKHRDYSESQNATHPEIMDALFDYGMGKLSISKAFGGQQIPLPVIAETLQSLSYYDASVSWQIAVQVAMGRLSDYVTEEAAEEIYGGTKRFVIGAIHAGGVAVPENGGYRLSGRWSFASGSRYADWLVCTAIAKSSDAEAKSETRMFFVPADKCLVLDTWDTLGMRGTGSNDFECQDVWVSEKLSVDADLLKRAPADRATRGYITGYYDFGTIAALATVFGISRAALELFRDNRKPSSESSLNSVVSEKVGRALSLLYSAKLLLNDAIDQALVPNDGTLVGTHPRVAAADATGTENSVNAVNQIYSLAGASGVYKRNHLERHFRDIHTGSKHFTLSPTNFLSIGSSFLEQRQ